MRAGSLAAAALILAVVPLGALAALLLAGAVATGPALLAIAAITLGAVALALFWARDVERLNDALRHATQDNPPDLPPKSPILPPLERMARRTERQTRALAARTRQFEGLLHATEGIVERLPDPLLILNADRDVRRSNAAARAAFGAELGAVLRHPGLRTAIDQAYASRDQSHAELTLPVPIAREVQATVIFLDPPLADGGTAIVVLSDRTRDRAVERMRADFVANASHELRTPLASLMGFVETLRGPAADDPPAQARFLAIMAGQAERMNRLIDDLLSLSRIELTEHQPPSDSVDLARLAHSIAAGFEPRLAERQVTLDLAIDPGLPLVTADSDQIAQVLSNLIDNAVKYGREQGIVRLTLAAAPPGGRWPTRDGVLLSVSDDGPGIPRAQVPRLTERFYRVDKGRSRTAGGTGLCLAIVKHIVNRHRGQLAIESDEGKGASFTVWLPAHGRKETDGPAAV